MALLLVKFKALLSGAGIETQKVSLIPEGAKLDVSRVVRLISRGGAEGFP